MYARTHKLATVALVALLGAGLVVTPVVSAAGDGSPATSARLGQTGAGNTPTAPPDTADGSGPTTPGDGGSDSEGGASPGSGGDGSAETPVTERATRTPTADSSATPATNGSEAAVGPPSVRVVNDSVAPGGSVVVTATFNNTGTASGLVEAEFRVFDETVDRQQVQVPAGEAVTVRFERRLGEPGRYRFAVNGQTAAVNVVGEETETEGGSSTRGDSLLMVGVVLIAGGLVLAIRRL